MKKLAILIAVTPLFASAGLFRFSSFDVAGFNAQQDAEIQLLVENEVNKNLPSADTQNDYFSGMSEANAMSAAGVTTSYGTVFNQFLLGVTASGGAHLGSKNFTDFGTLGKNPEQLRGFGAQAAIIAGINVGNVIGFDNDLFDTKKLKFYLSGFALDKKIGDVNAKYFGLGINAQYRFFDEVEWIYRTIKWTGLDISTGLLYSKLDVDAAVNLNKTYTGTYQGQPVTATLSNSRAIINAKVSTISIPIEASTGIRFFYFLKLVGGLGVDLNFGKTSGTGNLSSGSTVTGNVSGNAINGTPEFNLNGSAGPNLLNARVFAGPHIEFGVGSIFANIHKSLFKNAIAANAGVNFFW